MIRSLLLLGVLPLLVGRPTGLPPAPMGALHRFHVSYGRLAVEDNVAVCQVRFFRHDLEEALRRYHHDPGFKLTVDPRADSLYVAYFKDHFVLKGEGQPLQAALLSSGEDREGSEDMWWYSVQFVAPASIHAVEVTNTLLFDLFDDQKNIVKLQHFPSEASQTFYFTEDDAVMEATF